MKTSLQTFLFLCIASLCYGQTDFRGGYFVTHVNDTVRGLIDYRQGTSSYRLFEFKRTKDAPVITYYPDDVSGYGFINDKYYQSRSIDSTLTQPVFLEVIVKGGAASLYRYEHSFFVEKGNLGLESMTNDSELDYVNGRRINRYSNKFIATASMLFFDCVDLRDDIQRLKLGEQSLTEFVEAYNKCSNARSTTFKATKPWLKVAITVAGGINAPTLHAEDLLITQVHPISSMHAAAVPVGGVLLDISSPRLNDALAFHTGLLYKRAKYYAYGTYADSDLTVRHYLTHYLKSVEVPVAVRYTFPARTITPFIQGGLSYSYTLRSRNHTILERERNNVVETFYRNDISLGKSQMGFWVGTGSIVKLPYRFDAMIDLRIGRSSHFMMVDALTRLTTVQLLVGIRTK